MRRLVVALVGLALLAGCGRSAARPSGDALAPLRKAAALAPCPAGVGDVPRLTLPCLGGGPDVVLRGTPAAVPTLVNVYGSWCAPCQAEMPLLASFAARAGSRVALLGVDTEDEPRLALLFARDLGQHWPAVVDEKGTFLRAYSTGPPVTLFVTPAGRVAYVRHGAFRSVAEIVAAVRQHLGVTV